MEYKKNEKIEIENEQRPPQKKQKKNSARKDVVLLVPEK